MQDVVGAGAGPCGVECRGSAARSSDGGGADVRSGAWVVKVVPWTVLRAAAAARSRGRGRGRRRGGVVGVVQYRAGECRGGAAAAVAVGLVVAPLLLLPLFDFRCGCFSAFPFPSWAPMRWKAGTGTGGKVQFWLWGWRIGRRERPRLQERLRRGGGSGSRSGLDESHLSLILCVVQVQFSSVFWLRKRCTCAWFESDAESRLSSRVLRAAPCCLLVPEREAGRIP